MYNWSTDTTELRKNSEKYKIWKLEQGINFGLGTVKLNLTDLTKYINILVIDSDKKRYLKFLISKSK